MTSKRKGAFIYYNISVLLCCRGTVIIVLRIHTLTNKSTPNFSAFQNKFQNFQNVARFLWFVQFYSVLSSFTFKIEPSLKQFVLNVTYYKNIYPHFLYRFLPINFDSVTYTYFSFFFVEVRQKFCWKIF